MSKYHRRIYDGTFASLSDSTAKLYSVIRFAKNHKTNICHYHDDTLISMTGQSNGTFYKAKKNLRELGIIDYDSHPGDSKQTIRYLHDVDMIKNTSINIGEVDTDINDSSPNIIQGSINIGEANTNIILPCINNILDSTPKNNNKPNDSKHLYDHTKTSSVPSSLNISIVSSNGDFSRNSEEEKRIGVINEAMDYVKRLNQETDMNRKALYIKRLPDYLNRVPEKDRKSLSEMIRLGCQL
jgi:hypothetical protein